MRILKSSSSEEHEVTWLLTLLLILTQIQIFINESNKNIKTKPILPHFFTQYKHHEIFL